MGPVPQREEDGATATVSIAGYFTGKCRDYTSCSRQVLAWRGGGTREREPSHSSRHASPMHKNQPGVPKVSKGTRNTNKNNKNKKIKIYIIQEYKKTIIKKRCTLPPSQQQDGQAPQPAEEKVVEPCEGGDQELIAPPPPPEQIRKR